MRNICITALGIGIVFGVLLHLIYGTRSMLLHQQVTGSSVVGQGYVALLQMIVMPLIFISIVAAFTKIQIGEKFAKIGSIHFYLFNWHCHHCCDCWCCVCLGVSGYDASTINLGNAEQARGSEIAKQAKESHIRYHNKFWNYCLKIHS